VNFLKAIWGHLPGRAWLYLGIAIAGFAFKWWYDARQQDIGALKCENAIASAIAGARAQVEREAVAENSKLEAQLATNDPLIVQWSKDYAQPSVDDPNCKPANAERVQAVNAAHRPKKSGSH
jgi:hypothetical protein